MGRKMLLRTLLCCTAMYGAHRTHTSYELLEKYLYLPISRTLPGEWSHKLALQAVKWYVPPLDKYRNDALKTKVFGMDLENPIGLAAGFDKDGEAIRGCRRLGFGFTEVGSITPQPQSGNEKPRVFKLREDEAIINRYGFPSVGHMEFINNCITSHQPLINVSCMLITRDDVSEEEIEMGLDDLEAMGFGRTYITVMSLSKQANKIIKSESYRFNRDDKLKMKSVFQIIIKGHPIFQVHFQSPSKARGIEVPSSSINIIHFLSHLMKYFKPNHCGFGINIGVNKTTADPLNDYIKGVNYLSEFANYLVINVSSPNTPGLRKLQNRDKLERILTHVSAYLARIKKKTADNLCPPLLLKISPDLSDEQLKDIIELVENPKYCVGGLIISNTTVSRPDTLSSNCKSEVGGLSGKPLKNLSTEMIRKVYTQSRGKVKIVGVGGVQTAEDAYEKIKAGASLVQLYSGIVYNGLGSIRKIKIDLVELLKRDGYTNIEEAVGADNKLPELPAPLHDGIETHC